MEVTEFILKYNLLRLYKGKAFSNYYVNGYIFLSFIDATP